ncbi:DUF2972 domain-containing protein [uncultured Helicobacter sp.]
MVLEFWIFIESWKYYQEFLAMCEEMS